MNGISQIKDNAPAFLSLVTPFALLVSILYHWGYWTAFKIDIFGYIALADIIKLALFPLIYLIVVAAVTTILMYFADRMKHGPHGMMTTYARFEEILVAS